MKTISIADDFSDVPWGRYPTDGEFCGENFREHLLVPALHADDKVTVTLDGVEGYGSSFLDEAFGGLVHKNHFSAADLERRLEVIALKPEYQIYRDLIWRYIKEAGKRLAAA